MQFQTVSGAQVNLRDFQLVVAGYTGRDLTAVQEHIDELAAIGVPPPETVPMFYEMDPGLLMQQSTITVSNEDSSGEVEPVLIRVDGRVYLGVGSDHTDREVERTSVLASKAACPKPISSTLIEVDRVREWDSVLLSSHRDGGLYQQAELRSLRPPLEVLAEFEASRAQSGNLVMFGGTVPVEGGAFAHGSEWALRLQSPDGAVLEHTYSVRIQPGSDQGRPTTQ